MSRLEIEVQHLFGEETLVRARCLDPAGIDAAVAAQVAEDADNLLDASGQPDRQRELVQDMGQDRRLVLCRWLIDKGIRAKITKPSRFVRDRS